jgi:hypothetical protein
MGVFLKNRHEVQDLFTCQASPMAVTLLHKSLLDKDLQPIT